MGENGRGRTSRPKEEVLATIEEGDTLVLTEADAMMLAYRKMMRELGDAWRRMIRVLREAVEANMEDLDGP